MTKEEKTMSKKTKVYRRLRQMKRRLEELEEQNRELMSEIQDFSENLIDLIDLTDLITEKDPAPFTELSRRYQHATVYVNHATSEGLTVKENILKMEAFGWEVCGICTDGAGSEIVFKRPYIQV